MSALRPVLAFVLASGVIAADRPAPPASMPPAQGIAGVVAAGHRLEHMATGIRNSGGIIAEPHGDLLICDGVHDRVMRLDRAGQTTPYGAPGIHCTGLAIDRRGRLMAAIANGPRIAIVAPGTQVLADSWQGQPLVKPNDLVVDRKGGVYVSDPLNEAKEPPPPGRKPMLFYLRPDGRLTAALTMEAEPNGVILSPDEHVLYAVDGDAVDRFTVRADGSLGDQRTFANFPQRRPDGFAVDRAGRLYVTLMDGIAVLAPSGRVLGLIPSSQRVSSLAFGGPDRHRLFAAINGEIYAIDMIATGLQERMK